MKPQDLESRVRADLWTPCISKRAAQLAHSPCPLEDIVRMGHYLGIDAALHPHLMWLCDCALTPEMPVGWTAVTLPDGQQYYAHAGCGLAQWEHPLVAFLTGVARRLLKGLEEGARQSDTEEQEKDKEEEESRASTGGGEKEKA